MEITTKEQLSTLLKQSIIFSTPAIVDAWLDRPMRVEQEYVIHFKTKEEAETYTKSYIAIFGENDGHHFVRSKNFFRITDSTNGGVLVRYNGNNSTYYENLQPIISAGEHNVVETFSDLLKKKTELGWPAPLPLGRAR